MTQVESIIKQLQQVLFVERICQEEKWKRGDCFNIFQILGVATSEVRLHSAFLAERSVSVMWASTRISRSPAVRTSAAATARSSIRAEPIWSRIRKAKTIPISTEKCLLRITVRRCTTEMSCASREARSVFISAEKGEKTVEQAGCYFGGS